MPDQFDYQKTFGTASGCACTDCRALGSPAWYLAQILFYLSDSERAALFGPVNRTVNGKTVKTVRRPDLAETQLSCINTGTRIQALDPINEVLEYAVAVPPADPPTPPYQPPLDPWPQTIGDSTTIGANPEHVLDAAYDILAQEVYSWDLPFDLPAAEARVYLEKLGVNRADLMETFQSQLGVGFAARALGSWAAPTDVDIAAEYLMLTPAERRIITTRLSVKTARAASTGPLVLSGLQTVDGVALADGDRVLVKDQAAGGDPANGIYLVNSTGAWTRAPEADPTTLHDGALVRVAEGGQQGTSWALTTRETFVVGTDSLRFEPFTSAGDPDTQALDAWRYWYGDSDQALATAEWTNLKLQVPLFLKRSGLSFQELVDLLHTRYINPGPLAANITVIQFPKADCDVDSAVFQPPLTDAALNRIHRFTRLRRKLGWTSRGLDQALTALAQPDITDQVLMRLAEIQRIRTGYKLPLLEVLSWWAVLDCATDETGTPSFYEETFQNRSVSGADAFALDPNTRTELATPGPIRLTHKPGMIAALAISGDDLDALLKTLPNQTLNLANLSALYRHASLARALQLPILQLLVLLDLSGLTPFDPPTPGAAWWFLRTASQVKASGFSIPELDYILRDRAEPADAVAPTAELIGVTLAELQEGLQKMYKDTVASVDPTGALLRGKLGALFPNNPVKVQAAIDFVATGVAANPKQFIVDHYGAFIDPDDALLKLVTTPLADVGERYAYVYRWSLGEGFVIQKLAPLLKLDSAVVSILLKQALRSPAGGRSALAELLDATFVTANAPAVVVVDSFRKIWKAALVLRHLKATGPRMGTADEPAWVVYRAAGLGWLDLNALPSAAMAADPKLFLGWRRLVSFFGVWDGLPSGAPDFFSILDHSQDGGALADYAKELAARTGWTQADLDTLAASAGLGLVYPQDFADERALVRLATCMRMLRRLRVSANQVIGWIRPGAGSKPADLAREIRQTVKARFQDDAAWAQAAQPLQDILRERRRDALSSYLIAQRGFADSNALHDWFLLDVLVTPAVSTSRIKQAIGSVQHFVQRAILNLEDQVHLDAKRASHWVTWLGSEQLAEANLKVFLWPENWVIWSLLPHPTPFFDDLLNELLQREVTADSAEEAYRHYLEKLDQVARLEIVGMFHEKPDGEPEVLHVFGRTYNDPHLYFYRRRMSGFWSPWERVEVDIQGNHLMPVVHNRRLHLFWPIFTEKAKDTKNYGNETELHVQLAWSEYKNGRWTPKKLSSSDPGSVMVWNFTDAPDQPPHEHYVFHAAESSDDGTLRIRVLFNALNATKTDDNQLYGQVFIFPASGGPPVVSHELGLRWTDLVQPPHTGQSYNEFARNSGDGFGLTLSNGSTVDALNHSPSDYRVLVPHQYAKFVAQDSFFYQDRDRVFFAEYVGVGWPSLTLPGLNLIGQMATQFQLSHAAIESELGSQIMTPVAPRDPESIALIGSTHGFGGLNS